MQSFFEMTMVISIDQLTTNRPLMTGVWSILILTGQLPTLLYPLKVFYQNPLKRSNFVTYLACPMLSMQSSIRQMGNVSVLGTEFTLQ